MDDLKKENIKISSVSDENWGIKIKDERGLIFNVSKTKKDGSPTRAFQQLEELPNYGMGMVKEVAFAEVENKMGGKSRYVRFFSEPSQESTMPNNSYNTPQNANSGVSEEKLIKINENIQKLVNKITELDERIKKLEENEIPIVATSDDHIKF